MPIAFGRVVIDGVVQDDPYMGGLEKLDIFRVVSDSGGTYRVEQVPDSRPHRWRVFLEDASGASAIGSVEQVGNLLGPFYHYYRAGHRVNSGSQSPLINAVSGLIQ